MVVKPQQWREYANRARSVEAETRRGPLAAAGRIAQLLITDLYALNPRFRLVALVVRLLPSMVFGWLRPSLYRLGGVHIGPRCRVLGPLDISGEGRIAANVRIGSGCVLTTPLFLNPSAPITIGDDVSIGHHVVLITDTHEYNDPSNRCGTRVARPVTIDRGARDHLARCNDRRRKRGGGRIGREARRAAPHSGRRRPRARRQDAKPVSLEVNKWISVCPCDPSFPEYMP